MIGIQRKQGAVWVWLPQKYDTVREAKQSLAALYRILGPDSDAIYRINEILRKNPAPRKPGPKFKGARNIGRKSQATGKAPTKRLKARRARNVKPGAFPNPAARAVTQDDMNAAARGLGMIRMDASELRALIKEFQGNGSFASQGIVAAAKQMLAAKKRVGLIHNPAPAPAKRVLLYTVQYEPPESREHGADSPLSYVGWKTVATFADKAKAFEYCRAFAKQHKLRARVIN